MIKIFRRIRLKLIGKGKLKNYLMYAIGEILLVMIGILLAFQVNNWNENKKLRTNEISVLNEVKRNIGQNIMLLENYINSDSISFYSGKNLIDILKDENSIYSDSLDTMFGSLGNYIPYFAIDGAYENLKQKGLGLIQNDQLKQVLITLFEQSLPELEQTGNAFEFEVGNRKNDMALAYFETGATFFSMRPNNFEELKKNQKFINFVTWAVAAKKLAIDFRYNSIQKSINAKNILEAYLEKID